MTMPTSTTAGAAPVSQPRIPLRERLNLRILGFIAIFGLLLGWPLYVYLDATLTGGIRNRGDYFEVDLKAMSTFAFDQANGTIEDVPQVWRELDGKTVLMEGEIAPGNFSSDGVAGGFELVYSVAKCCYSGPPQIQHFVKVRVPNDAEVSVTHDGAVRVKGQLRVDVTRDPDTGKINGVYHVTANEVKSI